jgi:hypothetical protein
MFLKNLKKIVFHFKYFIVSFLYIRRVGNQLKERRRLQLMSYFSTGPNKIKFQFFGKTLRRFFNRNKLLLHWLCFSLKSAEQGLPDFSWYNIPKWGK